MSDVLGFIIGAGVGVAGSLVLKGKGNSSEVSALKRQLEDALEENEKLRRRYKEAERQNEDLLAELEKLQRHAKSNSSDREDLRDDLDDATRKIKKLTSENNDLLLKIKEYSNALAATQNK